MQKPQPRSLGEGWWLGFPASDSVVVLRVRGGSPRGSSRHPGEGGVVVESGIYGNVLKVGTMDGESMGPTLSEAIDVNELSIEGLQAEIAKAI